MLLWNRLKKNRLIALLAPERVEDCLTAYETLNPLGVTLEIALRTPVAVDGIKAIKERHPSAMLLAGTVMTHHQADLVIDAGAAGVVSADYIPIVTEVCARRDVMNIPGGTADVGKQLVQKASLYNCELEELRIHHPYQWVYKLFPAMAGGTQFLDMARSWTSVYQDLLLVYTGGVNADNVQEIMFRDSEAIICGSALTRQINEPDRMKEDAELWLAKINNTEPATQTEHHPQPAEEAEPVAVTATDATITDEPPAEVAKKKNRLWVSLR